MELEELAQRVKNRHYEKLAQREKAPILFNTASPMCQSFSQGLQQCAYHQDKWPTVWYETQNQHCTALLNIVASQLEALNPPETTTSVTTTTVVPSEHVNDTSYITSSMPVNDWFDFGLGYGFGLSGYLILLMVRYLCRRLYDCISFRSTGTVPQLPVRAPFAFVRGAPSRLPAVISAPDVRADIAISYTETINPAAMVPAEV